MGKKGWFTISVALVFFIAVLLLLSCKEEVVKGDSEVLARVGGDEITRADIDAEIELYPESEQYRLRTSEGEKYLIEQLINRRVLELAARSAGIDNDPLVQRKIDAAIKGVIAGEFYREYIRKRMWIPEDELKQYYNEHRDRYKTPERRVIRHIMRANKSELDDIYEQLEAGESFEELAMKMSQDKFTRDTGGLIGSIAEEIYEGSDIAADPKVHQVAFSLNEGEYSKPFKHRYGYSILKVDEIVPPKPAPFEDVVGEVAKDFAVPEEKVKEYYNENKEKFKQDEMIKITHGYFGTEKEARDALVMLKEGSTFEEVFSTSPMPESAKKKGYQNWLRRGTIIPTVGKDEELESKLFALEVGEYYGPYKSEKGWHIFYIEDRKEEGYKEYEDVKDTIKHQLVSEYADKASEKAFLDLMEKYGVVNYVELGTYRMLTPEQILEEARNARTPLTSFNAYRAFTILYPDHPDAHKALFMMGFIQSEELNDYGKARALFEEYIEKYPRGSFADDASWMLENLKTGEPFPENMKKEIEELGEEVDETRRIGPGEMEHD